MARRRHRASARRSTERHRQSGREHSEEPESEEVDIPEPESGEVDIPEPESEAVDVRESAPEAGAKAKPEPAEAAELEAQPEAEPKAAPPAAASESKPRRQSTRAARRAPSTRIKAPRAESRASTRLSADRHGRSSRREAEESRAAVRPSGRHRAPPEKPRNYAPIIIGAVVAALVAIALSYRPMEKRSYVKAVAAGGKLGYEAANAMPSFGTGAISSLCGIVERGPDKGRLAAAAGLAQVARAGGAREVVGTIRERLEKEPSADARAAYAAALSQARDDSAIKLVAPLVTDQNPSVRKCVVQGLAYGNRTPAAAAALGQALGDEDPEIRRFALETLVVWADRNADLMLNALDAAIRLEAPSAHEGAARLLVYAAGRAGDERLKSFLSKDSPRVRKLALGAVMRSNTADPEIHKRLAEIIASPAEPVEVKAAALDAARVVRAVPAGEAALAILKSRGDVRLRMRAAGAVAATCPEGAIDALLATLTDSGAPPKLRRGVLEALYSSGRISGKTQIKVARGLVKIAEGGDQATAGLALLALRSVSGLRAMKYGPAQWRKWLERREWEHELIDKAYLVLEKVKAEYAEHGDVDRALQSKLFNKVGSLLNKAYGDADQWDRDAIQAATSAIVRFKETIRRQ